MPLGPAFIKRDLLVSRILKERRPAFVDARIPSETTPEESRRAGEWERRAVRRAEQSASLWRNLRRNLKREGLI